MSKSPRDYGFGDSPKVVGVPIVGDKVSWRCPHCGCVGVFSVEDEIANPTPLLRRPDVPHKVVGRYTGCAACPWASPMMTIVVPLEPF